MVQMKNQNVLRAWLLLIVIYSMFSIAYEYDWNFFIIALLLIFMIGAMLHLTDCSANNPAIGTIFAFFVFALSIIFENLAPEIGFFQKKLECASEISQGLTIMAIFILGVLLLFQIRKRIK